jgi:Zn-dependent protease with chaperone function
LPSRIISILSLAYSRGCEYSADQVAFELTKSNKSAIKGLLSITLGSEALSDEMDIKSFVYQERNVPSFFGFLVNACSTHPRMTRRIEELLPKWDMIQETAEIKQSVVYDDSRYRPSMT